MKGGLSRGFFMSSAAVVGEELLQVLRLNGALNRFIGIKDNDFIYNILTRSGQQLSTVATN